MPNFLVMDNGTQFNNAKVESFGEMYRIRINFSPVYHLQANGMAEVTNKLIVGNLRRNLEDKRGAWSEELSKVHWVQRTMKKRSMDESPFAFVFGIEAMLPMEDGLPNQLLYSRKRIRERDVADKEFGLA